MGRYYNISYKYDTPKGEQNAAWNFLEEDEFKEVMDELQLDIHGKNTKVVEIEVKHFASISR